MQRNDYWGDFGQVLDHDTLTLEPSRWLNARSNEHRITLPLLIYTANIYLTHGDNRALSLLSLAFLLLTFACLWRLLPGRIRGSPRLSIAFGLPLAALVATPLAAHCWVFGFAGVQSFLANLSACAALLLFARAPAGAPWFALLPAFLATLPGALSHSTHLAIWPALLLAALLAPAPRGAAVFSAGSAAFFLALFAWGFRGGLKHPASAASLGAQFDFVAVFVGFQAPRNVSGARIWGGFGILLFLLALWIATRRPRASRSALAPWLALATYGGLQAVAASLARAGLGPAEALASRYAPLPALFWIGTLTALAIAALEAPDGGRRRLGLFTVGSATLLLLALSTPSGCDLLRQHLARTERQPLPALAVRWGIADDRLLRSSITPVPAQVQSSRAFFVRVRQIPFDRPTGWRLGEIPVSPKMRGVRVAGRWKSIAAAPGGFLAVAGTVDTPSASHHRILFLDRKGRLQGAALFVPGRGDGLPPLLYPRGPVATWSGYLRVGRAVSAVPYLEVEDVGGSRLVPLALPDAERRAFLRRLATPIRSEAPPSETPAAPD